MIHPDDVSYTQAYFSLDSNEREFLRKQKKKFHWRKETLAIELYEMYRDHYLYCLMDEQERKQSEEKDY